jgi:hypothetical protein
MTDKPEIKVGRRWTLLGGAVVTVLSTKARGPWPVVIQHDGPDNELDCISPDDLISLAPSTVKREVALYRSMDGSLHVSETNYLGCPVPASEPRTIEFTLLDGEEAE